MRLYVIPFMAIVTAWAVSRASLTNQDAALVASILSLMGYEAVGLILTKVKKSAVPLIIGPVDEPQSRPYYSVVDTDDAGRPAAHVEITNMDKPRRTTIGRTLREIYREPEDIPDEMTAFLKQLDDQNPDDL